MKPIKDYGDAIKELSQVTSCCAGSDRFIARTIPLLIKQNEKIIALLSKPPRPKKRKLSAYQKHCRRILLEGYTMKAAADSWRLQKHNG